MLYGDESISHYTPSNFSIWMLMAFQAGLLNMGGYLACHRFVSHVTGFATLFGYEVNNTNMLSALAVLTVPAFFLAGCMLSGILVDIRLKLKLKPKYYVAFGLMFFLLTGVLVGGMLGYFGVFGEPYEHVRNLVLVAMLCLICGIQNGTITTVSRSFVRTTHLTGATTDLGVGLARFIYRKKLGELYREEFSANITRIGIITFFILGSVAGGFVFKHLGYIGFAVPTATTGILFGLMYYFQVIRPPVKV